MQQLARDALRTRDEVLTVASHELKTPLTPLHLKLQQIQRLVARDGARVDEARLADLLRGADRHLDRLVKFIDDLLDVCRVVREPFELDLAPLDLARTVRACVARRRGDLERLGCDVRVDAPAAVVGRWDGARLAQALEQLLVNAMTYGPGQIEVEVRACGATASVRVRDHGPGIAPADQKRIFAPFERAVSSRNFSGFGLGLHAAHRIVEAHQGALRVESAPGEGSTFVVDLPLDASVPRLLD
jgi:signal transduction histidine kinase